jgi:hypothetical protein
MSGALSYHPILLGTECLQPSPDSNYFFQFDLSTGLTLGGPEAGTPLQHFDADIALGNIEYFENPFQWFHDGRSVLMSPRRYEARRRLDVGTKYGRFGFRRWVRSGCFHLS